MLMKELNAPFLFALQLSVQFFAAAESPDHVTGSFAVVDLTQEGLNLLDLIEPRSKTASVSGREQLNRIAKLLGRDAEPVQLLRGRAFRRGNPTF